MLAVSGRPTGSLEAWWVETKLDGWRAIVTVSDGRVRVRSRRGTSLTASVPELDCLSESGTTMILDGELVVGAGRLSDFYRLAGRLSMRKPTAANERVAFTRRQLLESLDLGHGFGIVPPYSGEYLDALLAASEREGMEGVVFERDRSTYRRRHNVPAPGREHGRR